MAPYFSTTAEQRRQHLIKAAISFKEGLTELAEPTHYKVLTQFALGRLTIDEVVYYLEAASPSPETSH